MPDWWDHDLTDRRRRGLYRVRRRLQSAQGPRVRLHGRDFVKLFLQRLSESCRRPPLRLLRLAALADAPRTT